MVATKPRRPLFTMRSVLGALLVLLLGGYFGLSFAAAWVLTRGSHAPLAVAATAVGRDYQDVTFNSATDNINLKGWLFHAAASNGRSVVMMHGWKQNRVNGDYTLGVARDLLAHHYDVLMFDERGCGESGGDSFTLGDKERYDVVGAYQFMRGRGYAANKMTVMGVSMGAAATIEASPLLTDVAALIPDSAFAALRPILEAQLPPRSHLPSFYNPAILMWASLLGDNPDLRPVDVVKSLPNRAFLFFHGAADDLIPVSHARELRAAATNPQSDLIITPNVGHTGSYAADPAAYMARVYLFIDQQVGERLRD